AGQGGTGGVGGAGQGGGGAGQGGTGGAGQGGTGGAPPIGDGTCASPFIIGPNQTVSGDTTGIVGVFDDASCGTAGTGNQGEAVYQITATATGVLSVTLNTDASDFDAVLYARTTCDDTTTELDCDDKAGSTNEVVTFNVVAGDTVYVVVDGWNDTPAPNGDTGPFVLTTETAVCGDGVVASIEPCDDGNGMAGDGCSPTCAVEAGYNCSGAPSVCIPNPAASCADPIVVSDGFNFAASDITAYGDDYNTFPPASCTNDGAGRSELVFRADLVAGETVNVSDFGAADLRLRILDGGMCGGATTCAASIDGPENTPGLSYTAAVAGPVYIVVETSSTTPFSKDIDLDFEIYPCGDGIIGVGEACDDGDAVGGDGCSAICKVEPGFICTGAPSTCGPVPDADCAAPIEVMEGSTFTTTDITAFGDDMGGLVSCDGNDGTGRVELVFSADLTAGQVLKVNEYGSADVVLKVLAAGACASGATCATAQNSNEETSGVRYAATAAETVFVVVEAASAAPGATARALDLRFLVGTCANGTTELAEGCDDGNTTAGDGCSPTCAVETGFACSGSPSLCAAPTPSTCANPISVADGLRFVGDTIAGFGEDLTSLSAGCFTDGTSRPDIVFSVPMLAGQTLAVKDFGTLDVVFKQIGTTCATGLGCVASFDGVNSTETTVGFSYTATANETVFLVVEPWTTGTAATLTYDLRFDISP
ncbi:MAG: hypothetical protein WKG00_29255, partial [Polyangiaceae bacterium]